MTELEFMALLPFTSLAALSVVLMLLLCFIRNHLLTLIFTLLGFTVAFFNLDISEQAISYPADSFQITSLLLIDRYFIFFAKIILLASGATALQAYQYFKNSSPHGKGIEEFYLLLSIATLGALVLVASQHYAAFFLGLEIMGISLFVMIAFPVGSFRKASSAVKHSLEAALKYLVLSSVASAFLLLGVAFLYAQTGSMLFIDAQSVLSTEAGGLNLLSQAALMLILVGVGFKLSLVPFHLWMPDIYQGAPTPVTAYIATVAKAAVIALFLRYFIMTNSFQYESVITVITVLAVVTMMVGNLLALRQDNIKRLLAYSSIAHVGYMFVAFLAVSTNTAVGVSELAIEAIAFYIAAYFVTTLGAFGVVTSISEHGELTEDRYSLKRYQGLFWRHPWMATCFIFMLLSLAGIPLTIGFIGKFYIFAAGAEQGLWGLMIAVVIGSAIALYYYLRIIIVLVQKEEGSNQPETLAWLDNGIVFTLTAILLIFGVYPSPLIQWIQTI
jgi:NADH-quinone oxidoreductase subunit N